MLNTRMQFVRQDMWQTPHSSSLLVQLYPIPSVNVMLSAMLAAVKFMQTHAPAERIIHIICSRCIFRQNVASLSRPLAFPVPFVVAVVVRVAAAFHMLCCGTSGTRRWQKTAAVAAAAAAVAVADASH